MKNLRKRLGSALLIFALLLTGILPLQNTKTAWAKDGSMTVHFLDVGQGLAILAESEGETLLYDGGPRSASSFVVSYLQEQQVSKIDYLISSHYDEDHVSGLIGCLNAFSVKNVIGADYVHDSSLYDSFINGVEAKGLTVQHPAVGTQYEFGSGEFTVLSPQQIGKDSNANSVAIKLTNGENSFIFTGDADYNSEADMVSSGIDLGCDVLSVGHHGSATATSWDFLQATVPEYAVISCGAGNMYGHPHEDTMEKLADMGILVYRTDKQGTIVVSSDGNSLSWNMEPCNDYTSGDGSDSAWENEEQGFTGEPDGNQAASGDAESAETDLAQNNQEEMVWISATGSKYHSIPDCGNMNPEKAYQEPLSKAQAQGYEACRKCF